MTLSFTKNLHLAVPDFLTEPWHAEFAQAMDSIDEIVFHALIAQDIDLWHNSTAYTIGTLVISPDTGGIFSAAVAHTSSPAPQTFAQEQLDHPTFWTPLGLRLATQAEAEAGIDNTKYMTPLRVAQAIDAQSPVSIASKSQAEAGTDNTQLMTPLRVAQHMAANIFSTGDAKFTFKTVADPGWVIANDGSIGNGLSSATTRANDDTSALFTLLYNNITSTKAQAVTISIAAPAVITKIDHGLSINQKVVFSTTGTLPSGITAGTPFFIISAGFTPNSFQVSATMSGAAVTTTGVQAGVHTATATFDLALQDNAGTRVARGANAAADFGAARRLMIPAMLGRTIAAAGSGTGLTLRQLGNPAGAETETQTAPKMAPHSHSMSSQAGVGVASPLAQYDPNQNMTFSGTNGVSGISIDVSGGGQPLNIMQPTQFLNVMIKL
jgi:hypothetical protein